MRDPDGRGGVERDDRCDLLGLLLSPVFLRADCTLWRSAKRGKPLACRGCIMKPLIPALLALAPLSCWPPAPWARITRHQKPSRHGSPRSEAATTDRTDFNRPGGSGSNDPTLSQLVQQMTQGKPRAACRPSPPARCRAIRDDVGNDQLPVIAAAPAASSARPTAAADQRAAHPSGTLRAAGPGHRLGTRPVRRIRRGVRPARRRAKPPRPTVPAAGEPDRRAGGRATETCRGARTQGAHRPRRPEEPEPVACPHRAAARRRHRQRTGRAARRCAPGRPPRPACRSCRPKRRVPVTVSRQPAWPAPEQLSVDLSPGPCR